MKGDITRSTFNAKKHFHGVLMQQGRVQIDADWNEQVDITNRRIEAEAADLIGGCGGPLHQAGFALSEGAMPVISEGHYYVDGILCENDAPVPLDKQFDLPVTGLHELTSPAVAAPLPKGSYIAYLDVWQRHITALEDSSIREVALGGPDTATRSKTLWQVKLLGPLTELSTCADEPPAWTNLLNQKTNGKMSARAAESDAPSGPCVVPPGAGYRRLENQLYRVEVHAVNASGAITMVKWSRDNGTIVTRWLNQEANKLIVSSIGRDDVLRFAPGQFVEVVDDRRDLRGEAGILVKIANAEGQVLTLDASDANATTVAKSNFPDQIDERPNNPKARRWDGIIANPGTANWIELEDGVQIKFEPGKYYVGDYWQVPARTALGDVEWPCDGATPPNPIAQPRVGVEHHYCKLAILSYKDAGFTVEDCRKLFPPLTELVNLLYVGGDGQEASAGTTLPQPLRVRVANGQIPVVGALVRFTARGGGSLSATTVATTNPDGIAESSWTLGSEGVQQVDVALLDAGGNSMSGQVVCFGAAISVASRGGCCISVGEGGRYESLDAALADLFHQGKRDICICLLPGEYPVSLDAIGRLLDKQELNLKITGSGLGSRVHLKKPVHFAGVRAVILRDMMLIAEGEIADGRGALVFENCGLVTIANCFIAGRTASSDQMATGTLMSIANVASVRLRDVRFEAFTSETFLPLLESFKTSGLDTILAGALNMAEANDLDFRIAALKVGNNIANLNSDKRKILKKQPDSIGNNSVLTEDELSNFSKLGTAVGQTGHSTEDYAAIIINMRRAAINARPGVALVLAPLPDAAPIEKLPFSPVNNDNFISIESCEFNGDIGLYGLPTTAQTFSQLLPTDRLKILQGTMTMRQSDSLPSKAELSCGTLELRGNRLLRISLALRMVQALSQNIQEMGAIGFFNEVLLTDNIFASDPLLVAAIHCGLANNQFIAKHASIGMIFAQTSVYSGNRGASITIWDITKERGEAANVRFTVK